MNAKPASAADRQIGRRLKLCRERQGVPLEDLASAMDVESDRLSRMEEGREHLTARHLLAAAEALRLPLGDFFADLRGQRADPGGSATRLDLEIMRLLHRNRSLELRRRIIALIEESASE